MAKEKTAIDIAKRFFDNGEVSSPKNCALLQIAIEAYAEQEVMAANAEIEKLEAKLDRVDKMLANNRNWE